MATFRGLDGVIHWNGANIVAQVLSWSINTVLEQLDSSVMGTTWRQNVGGMAQWTGNAACRLDYGDTLGQKDIVDEVMQATPTGASVAVIFFVDDTTAANKKFSGNAVVTGLNIVSQIGNIVELQVTLTGDGQLTPAWA